MLLLQNGRDETIQPINLYKKESYMARNQLAIDCKQSLFSWKIPGKKKNVKQVTLCHFRTLACFTFFAADFRGKERLLAVLKSAYF